MENIEWLLNGNPVVKRLTKKYLLDQLVTINQEGFIQDYLDLYNKETHQWGQGFYSPKWVSTHYTMMTLTDMEIDGLHPIYQDAFDALFDYLWSTYQHPPKHFLDMCIAGMLLKMAVHAKRFNEDVKRLIDYILTHKMSDGGWNCMLLRSTHPKISSVHTTLSVLEALDMYEQTDQTYRLNEVKEGIQTGVQCLLERNLIYIKGSNKPINEYIANHHYPPRWKYDYLRVLEFLAKRRYPLCDEIIPALNLLKSYLTHGRLTRGSKIAGRTHFKLEKEKYGYFNTLRAYKVLKVYDQELYLKVIHMNEI